MEDYYGLPIDIDDLPNDVASLQDMIKMQREKLDSIGNRNEDLSSEIQATKDQLAVVTEQQAVHERESLPVNRKDLESLITILNVCRANPDIDRKWITRLRLRAEQQVAKLPQAQYMQTDVSVLRDPMLHENSALRQQLDELRIQLEEKPKQCTECKQCAKCKESDDAKERGRVARLNDNAPIPGLMGDEEDGSPAEDEYEDEDGDEDDMSYDEGATYDVGATDQDESLVVPKHLAIGSTDDSTQQLPGDLPDRIADAVVARLGNVATAAAVQELAQKIDRLN